MKSLLRNVLLIVGIVAGLAVVGDHWPPAAQAQPLGNPTAFSQDWELVAPHDTNELARQPRAIMLAADGSVSMLGWGDDGTTCVSMSLVGAVIYPLAPRKICDTGTDASSVLVIY